MATVEDPSAAGGVQGAEEASALNWPWTTAAPLNMADQILAVTIPAGYGPGQQLVVQSPDGQTLQIVIPEGASPGQQIQISYHVTPVAPPIAPPPLPNPPGLPAAKKPKKAKAAKDVEISGGEESYPWMAAAAKANIKTATPPPLTAEDALARAAAEGLTLQPSDNTAGFKGVSYKRDKPRPYVAQVKRGGKSVTLGFFSTAEAAALSYARDIAANGAPGPTGVKAAKAAAAEAEGSDLGLGGKRDRELDPEFEVDTALD